MKAKQFISIFLLIILSWQSFYKISYLIYWKINQNYIIENFCVNKDKPTLDCGGKCYLNKELRKVDGSINSTKNDFKTEILKVKSFDLFVLNKINWNLNPNFFHEILIKNYSYSEIHSDKIHLSYFRPPKLV